LEQRNRLIIKRRKNTPSEYRKTKGGEKEPNSRESWLEVQAQALFQAEILIKSTIRDFAYQYFNRYNKQ
jgi:hypothetical protein